MRQRKLNYNPIATRLYSQAITKIEYWLWSHTQYDCSHHAEISPISDVLVELFYSIKKLDESN